MSRVRSPSSWLLLILSWASSTSVSILGLRPWLPSFLPSLALQKKKKISSTPTIFVHAIQIVSRRNDQFVFDERQSFVPLPATPHNETLKINFYATSPLKLTIWIFYEVNDSQLKVSPISRKAIDRAMAFKYKLIRARLVRSPRTIAVIASANANRPIITCNAFPFHGGGYPTTTLWQSDTRQRV